jgi:zinc and cadmium transporter
MIAQIILATFAITLCVWIAVLLFFIKKEILSKITLFLVSLSAGTLMGGAFLHLLPEASEKIESEELFLISLLAFVVFFLVEKILHWRHCHKGNCETHTFGYMNLVGDSIHNFIDGLMIAAAFIVDIKLGVITTFAIALHEIPQEIGDFGVLLHAGFKKSKALVYNYLVASVIVLGGIAGYFISSFSENIIIYLLPFAAGGFIYVASSDLLPELRKEINLKKSMASFIFFLIGIGIMYFLH